MPVCFVLVLETLLYHPDLEHYSLQVWPLHEAGLISSQIPDFYHRI